MREHEFVASRAGDNTHARYFRIEFSGSGSEYFRIWIVNLLLSLLTLGLYLPFAKARRLAYFYSNTRIADQALTFHGNPWKMLRGFLLLALLMLAYGAAGQVSPLADLLAFFILCAIWPALWRASLQFRLANTSWRGLRLGFNGGLVQAYRAFLPTYLPTLGLVVSATFFAEELRSQQPSAGRTLIFAFSGLAVLLFPLTLALIKRYQHQHYTLAAQQTHLLLGNGPFYLLALRTLLWSMAYSAVATSVIGTVAYLSGASMLLLIPLLGIAYVGAFSLLWPYYVVRLQNLLWNATRSEALRFDSKLQLRDYALLSLKNWLLTALTLGLYRPFAEVNSARLRLEAMSLRIEGELDDWVAVQTESQLDATGEAAGDFLGIDMGV